MPFRMNLRKQSLACLAILAACGAAQAQSNVTINGLIDLSAGRTQSPGAKAIKSVDSGQMSTSYIAFRGTEDLGGGLKAKFALDSFMRSDTGEASRYSGDSMFSRTSSVGLVGSFGEVNIGRITTGLFVNTLLFNAFGDSFGYSPAIRHYFTSSTATGDTGWNDSIAYYSPSVNGFAGMLHMALGENNGGRNSGAALRYFGGPLSAGFSWQQVEKGSAVADTDTWQLGAAYDLKVVKLFGQYGKVENKTTKVDYDITGLGATAPVGDVGVARLQWGQIDPSVGAKRKTFSVGYGYYLSKRTELYGSAMSDKIDGLSGATSYSVGIRHTY